MEPSGLTPSRPTESAETERCSYYCQQYCNNPPNTTTFLLFSELKTVIYTTKYSRSKIIFHNPIIYIKYRYIDKRKNFTTIGIPTFDASHPVLLYYLMAGLSSEKQYINDTRISILTVATCFGCYATIIRPY
jgi:hypothetical protein